MPRTALAEHLPLIQKGRLEAESGPCHWPAGRQKPAKKEISRLTQKYALIHEIEGKFENSCAPRVVQARLSSFASFIFSTTQSMRKKGIANE